MKTKLIIFALAFPLVSLADYAVPIIKQELISQIKLTDEILILEKNGISIYATSYTHKGNSYAIIEFKNTTKEKIRFLWSAEVYGNPITVNFDGTVNAFITLEPESSVKFGEFNSNNPLIEINSNDLKKDILVKIEIQK